MYCTVVVMCPLLGGGPRADQRGIKVCTVHTFRGFVSLSVVQWYLFFWYHFFWYRRIWYRRIWYRRTRQKTRLKKRGGYHPTVPWVSSPNSMYFNIVSTRGAETDRSCLR
jgi:hypothetical protein